jgi:hypothetical protein
MVFQVGIVIGSERGMVVGKHNFAEAELKVLARIWMHVFAEDVLKDDSAKFCGWLHEREVFTVLVSPNLLNMDSARYTSSDGAFAHYQRSGNI